MPDGRTITCKTGGQALKESVQDWTIEKACELCWVPLENAQKAVKLFAESKYGGIGNGVSQDQFIQSAESAMCVSILNQLKATRALRRERRGPASEGRRVFDGQGARALHVQHGL